jgi:hypothetical protein
MRARNEQGIALITVMLLLMLISTLLVGTTALVVKEQNARFQDHNRTSTFYAAHGGLEKLTNDLGRLFAGNYSPTNAQIQKLTETPPAIDGMKFDLPGAGGAGKGYSITRGEAENKTLAAGDYKGLKGIVTPYTVAVTAKSPAKSEVTLVRTLNSIAIPVFQFGIFSETDLSFFPGPEFNFGGKVHTNGNLYLAKGTTDDLILADKVTAYKDVIRTELSNGFNTQPAGNGYAGEVRLLTTLDNSGCKKPFTDVTCKPMTMAQGSLDASLNPNPAWYAAWHDTYKENIKNGDGGKGGKENSAGAVKLTLPITDHGAKPIDLIRRPKPGENTANLNLYLQRYYQLASVRILLSDFDQDLNDLPDKASGSPTNLGTYPGIAQAGSAGAGSPYLATAGQPLVTGFLKIEMQNQAGGSWTDVTSEWLGKPFTGGKADGSACVAEGAEAIIRIQRVKDSAGNCTAQTNRVPNVLYDPREGRDRDFATDPNPPPAPAHPAFTATTLYLGGVMHYVELDIKNLRVWLAQKRAAGAIMETTGYVVYFSDRRNNHNGTVAGTETGEYGFEDIVVRDGNDAPEAGEDTNDNGKTDRYGDKPVEALLPLGATAPLDKDAHPWTKISAAQARHNRAVLFRRALKLVNGGLLNMYHDHVPASGPTAGKRHGLTIVAENPVYIEGDYNADTPASGPPDYDLPHVACAVIADAVTLLSRDWKDTNSFANPTDVNGRRARHTTYRTAIVSGKGLSFTKPAGLANDFGTDGGTHNFLRYVEGWGAKTSGTPTYAQQTINYKGSIVSLYYNQQAVGTYKCCATVYSPPDRQFFFDEDFLDQNKLPPRTPMFRAIDVTSFSRLNEPPKP